MINKKFGVFLVLGLLVLSMSFVLADSISDIIDSGLQNVEVVETDEFGCVVNDTECLMDVIRQESDSFDCQNNEQCLMLKEMIDSENKQFEEEFSQEIVSAVTNSAPESNLKNIKQENIKEEMKKWLKAEKYTQDYSAWEKFLSWIERFASKIGSFFTGNVIRLNSEDSLELPELPSAPGNYEDISNPKLSSKKFKIFSLFTGNAIIGTPDWSFDGTNIERGNFVWDPEFTEQQGGLQHFDLKLDINFSKKDSQGKTPVNGIVNQIGYYLDENQGKWMPFNFTGTEIWSTDEKVGKNVFTGWLRAGMHDQPVPSASLTLNNHTKSDYSIFLTYSCMKFFEQSWECNEGKWVVHVVETGDVDYHSVVGNAPVMGYKEVQDLNISDVPSILKQFNVSLFEFQPPLHDVFITSGNSEVQTEKGNIETLEFYVKNFGNRNLTGIHFELDIGERSLAEVVAADLPQNLNIGEIKKGSVSVLFKEEHTQKITLWVKPSEAEVDTSDNLASYNIVVGRKPNIADVPNRTAYHGNTGELLVNWSNVEPYEEVKFGESSLEILSGVDKMRTIWGGYWNGTSINPTMQVFVKGMMNEEALFSTPFLSSISMGGKMLTGDREIVEYKVRFINSKTGVYYDTPVMQDSYIYHYNPKQLIPDFEWCTDYLVEVELMGSNHETVDVINENVLNVCNIKKIEVMNYFKIERLLKQDGNYVVITPIVSDLFVSRDVRYFVEFSDPKQVGKMYRTPVLNLEKGIEIVPVTDIFGNRYINYNSGEIFNGKVVLMDDLVFKDLEQQAFGNKYRVVGRDCRKSFNGTDLYGFTGMVGFDNWKSFNSDKKLSESFLCYDDKFYYCGAYYTYPIYKNMSSNVTNNQKVGSWSCINNQWVRDESGFVGVSINASKKVYETYTINVTSVLCFGNLSIYSSGISSSSWNISASGDIKFSPLSSKPVTGSTKYGDSYFVCSGILNVSSKNVTNQRVLSVGNENSFNKSLHFIWNDWDMGINILFNTRVELKMKDELIRYDWNPFFDSRLENGFRGLSFLTFKSGRTFDLRYPGYMDSGFRRVILSETDFRYVVYDLNDNKAVLDEIYFGGIPPEASATNFYSLTENKLKNGHFYEMRISVVSKNTGLYAPIEPVRLFYVDGWNFILNNKLLYSRFFEMQNYPTTVTSYLQNDEIPTVKIDFDSANIYYDSCEGYYKKFDDLNQRYINLIDECVYPHGVYINFEGAKKPIFSSMSMTLYPVESLDQVQTRRTNFNCKIGRFDGVCERNNNGYQFIYFDERTNLVYDINLVDGDRRFIKKYRDASGNGTTGNPYDTVLYDILMQIDGNPIKDFDLDFDYGNPVTLKSIAWWVLYGHNNPTLVKWGDYQFFDNFLWSHRGRAVSNWEGEIIAYDKFFSDGRELIVPEGNNQNYLKDAVDSIEFQYSEGDEVFFSIKNRLGINNGNGFRSQIVFNYSDWFFKQGYQDYISGLDSIIPGNNVSYDFTHFKQFWGEPWIAPNFKKGELNFAFTVNPKNHTSFEKDFKSFSDYMDFYLETKLNSIGERWSIMSATDWYNPFLEYLSPSVQPISGGISRSYKLTVYQKDDIYEYFADAPKNCDNRHDTEEFRDVVCSSRIIMERIIENSSVRSVPVFTFTCSWSNIDELKTYNLTMNQVFYNRTVEQVTNLPTETIKEMRDEFFYPVLRAHLEALPPTPVLATTYATFDDVELRNNFCV